MTVSIVSAFDEFGDPCPILGPAADDIAKQRDLGITRDRELYMVAMDDDQVVGAAWTAFDGENYEFDVAVAPGHDRKGIGRALTRAAISERRFFTEGHEDTTMLIPVTSLAMCRLLQQEGFVITEQPAKGFFTMGHRDEHDPLPRPELPESISADLTP